MRLRFFIVGLSTLLLAMNVQAERADREKPTQIEADRASYDDLKQVSIWEGNVVLVRGTLVIRALRLEMRQDPEGFQYGTAFGNAERLAYFRQKRDAGDQYIEGYGERIDYDGKADRLILTTRATTKRLEGATVVDEVHGNIIEIDNRTDTYVVNGSAVGTTPTTGGRVRAVIAPRIAPTQKTTQGGVILKSAPTISKMPPSSPVAPK